jgi:hypothetical protein
MHVLYLFTEVQMQAKMYMSISLAVICFACAQLFCCPSTSVLLSAQLQHKQTALACTGRVGSVSPLGWSRPPLVSRPLSSVCALSVSVGPSGGPRREEAPEEHQGQNRQRRGNRMHAAEGETGWREMDPQRQQRDHTSDTAIHVRARIHSVRNTQQSAMSFRTPTGI